MTANQAQGGLIPKEGLIQNCDDMILVMNEYNTAPCICVLWKADSSWQPLQGKRKFRLFPFNALPIFTNPMLMGGNQFFVWLPPIGIETCDLTRREFIEQASTTFIGACGVWWLYLTVWFGAKAYQSCRLFLPLNKRPHLINFHVCRYVSNQACSVLPPARNHFHTAAR